MKLTVHICPGLRLQMNGMIPPVLHYDSFLWTGITFWDFMFTHCGCELSSSKTWHIVGGWVLPDVMPSSSRIKQSEKNDFDYLTTEDEGTVILWNTWHRLIQWHSITSEKTWIFKNSFTICDSHHSMWCNHIPYVLESNPHPFTVSEG